MNKVLEAIKGVFKTLLSPEMGKRRDIRPGFQRENIPVWLCLMALYVIYQVALGGRTYELFVPDQAGMAWLKVPFPVLNFAVSAGILLFATGISLFPKNTAVLGAIAFSFFYLYGAASNAPVDLLLGFAQPLASFVLIPIFGEGSEETFTTMWETLHFPGLGFYAFHVYLPFYIFFTSILAFLHYPAGKNSPRHRPSWVDVVLCVVTIVYTLEYMINFEDRGDRSGMIQWSDVLFGAMCFLATIELCRRVLGWVLPTLAIFFFIYNLTGPYFPGKLAHNGFSVNETLAFIYGNEGIYGLIANVYASYVFLFVAFGVFLEKTKVGDVFVDLAFALVGRLRGGPAKASVISSGLVGSVVGSGAANIVITGTFTIPLMKRAGFRPHYAAAVETVSSVGGQLMPPVMGSAVFLVAAFTETDYGYIAIVSLVPALMYYFSVYMSVHFQAGRMGIHGLPKEELPALGALLKKDGYLLLPVVLLICRLIIGRSPFDAALWSILLALVLGMFREDTRLIALPPLLARPLGLEHWSTSSDKQKLLEEKAEESESEANQVWETSSRGLLGGNWMLLAGAALWAILPAFGFGGGESLFWALVVTGLLASPRLMDAFEKAALNSLIIGATVGVMGAVLAGVALPGLGLKFSSLVVGYSGILRETFGWVGSELPMAILLCALASYVLGMGMTITASYVLLSILAVPALVELNVPLVNAHLMIVWLSLDAALTPPFALGSFISAGLAGANPIRTGFAGLKLAKVLYIMPFLMAYTPILMNPGTPWWEIGLVWVSGFTGLFCTSAALEGYMRRDLTIPERVLFGFAGALLFFHVGWMKITGTLLLALGAGRQYLTGEAGKA
ncbi:MAG: TRAP transporter fused permease subunit, partial [Nitrospinaceae bacterium]|nr:TRAP transporter fused permease subunit [Nitrospinaceae bacterium]